MIRFILGTRPEAIKVKPILRILKQRKVAFEVIHTGQHDTLLQGTGLKPDVSLGIASSNDPMAYAVHIEAVLRPMLHEKAPQWVVVQGDTASARGGAQAAVYAGIPVCHVEAGLRSHDERDPWPEEGFRYQIDVHSDLKCCPTAGNLANLKAEGYDAGSHVTGNTIVDALRHSGVTRSPGTHVLITLHRREAFGEPLRAILDGLAEVARQHPDTPFLWPVHPNPKVKKALEATALPVNVLTRPPLPYLSFLSLLASAKAVLTDSGGVIEEACTLGVPTVIARDKTERPEAVETGIARLAGKASLGVQEGLAWAFRYAPALKPGLSDVFGDGHAAERIVDLLTC